MKKNYLILVFVFSFIGAKAQLSTSIGSTMIAFRNFSAESVNFRTTGALHIDLGYYFHEKNGIKTGIYYQRRNIEIQNINYNSEFYQIPVLYTYQKKIENYPIGYDISLGYLLSLPVNVKNNNSIVKISPISGAMGELNFFIMINQKTKFYTQFIFSNDLYSKEKLKFGQYGVGFGMSFSF